ncbi:helix-turn-helix domain-containing protein [Streptomyces hainanensis]|uniref:XRE family transcriptional regulator n=1 Tax=Streptomyces hainanensis TaxID=402648 RepID=A0A4R4T5B0_9ACTN|nr:helix-turn-helix transcriptional regulator [Streptomyces hainanensis]TDC72218.1 XRE family transcriptional regulator [Streptomyces hainanensis]
MPPRQAPTARQRRLGTELRKLRERAGMTAPEAAAELNTNRTGISNLEAGRFGVSAERVRVLARIYHYPDEQHIDALADMADERGKGWWEEYRGALSTGALDVAELEYHAKALRTTHIMHVPGLLQTEEYAKVVLATDVPWPNPQELRRRLSFRMRRRDVLDRTDAPHCTFMVHESALRIELGGAKVARGQLEHLLDASERDNITIRVIPFSAGAFPNVGISTVYAAGPVPRLDTVHLEVPHGSSLIDSETHLVNYRVIMDYIEGITLSPSETRDLMRSLAHQL